MRRLLPLVALLALVGAGAVVWLAFWPNVTAPPEGAEAHSIRLPPETTFDAALDSLGGAVKSTASLRLFGQLTGWGEQVKTGHYLVAPGMSNWALLDKIRKGLQDPIQLTLPGGLTPQRLGRVLSRQLGTDSAAVVAALADPALAERLGTDPANLFGRMRANTYDILWTTDAERAVERIEEWSDRFWTDSRLAQARALGLSRDEVVTLASIVEWEARQPDERRRIAGVYVNRLLGRTPSGRMRLQADPTVQYALLQAGEPQMRRLLFVDYQTPSPYNTYLIDGLPPGPITNPTDESIDAVLDPEPHQFLYFVADGSGGHDFSETVAEHNAKAARWSRWLSEQVRIRRERERAEAAGSASGAATGTPAAP